jgi:arabinofuranosyltransferase
MMNGLLPKHRSRGVLYIGLFAFALLALRTAWICDDAYISLRTASNWIDGYGLRWNVAERVQTFTHPLWLLLLTAAHLITREPFYSTLFLSWIVSCTAVAVLLLGRSSRRIEALIALLVLCFSQAFVDFSSGGLENPLTHLFIAAFVSVYFTLPIGEVRFRWLAAIAGLAAVNRLDTLLLFGPALAACALREGLLQRARQAAFAALPLVLWEAFSLGYFGFPFPNTAYAKLTQGQDGLVQRWLAGVAYLASSWDADPLTLATIATCVLLAIVRRDRERAWLLVGAVSYVAYTIYVGGDFMSGRFLAAPLLLCVCCFASSDWLRSPAQRATWAVLVLAAGLGGRWPPPLTGADFGLAPGESELDRYGIHNERRLFFPTNSLLNASRINPAQPTHPWTRTGVLARAKLTQDPASRVQVIDAIGLAGYYAGPSVHIVDRWALADALLARLPSVSGKYGHYPRVIPDGYLETLRTGDNRIADEHLADYYDALALALRGPLLSPERLRAIWQLNRGMYRNQLDAYAYVRAARHVIRVRVQNVTSLASVTTYIWNDGRTTGHTLDESSRPGSVYDVVWQIDPDGATLLSPSAPQTARFDRLRPRGVFTLSVGFAQHAGGPIQQVYELRYAYTLRATEIEVQRQPAPAWNSEFPGGTWRNEGIDAVLVRTDTGTAAGAGWPHGIGR